MPGFLSNFSLDSISFGLGFISGVLLLWILGKLLPIIRTTWRDWRANRLETRSMASSATEVHFRFDTLRLAQRMHLAAPLFALDEIAVAPRLQAPPIQVEPGQDLQIEDIATLTIPYLPDWPELPAVYRARTLTMAQALSQDANLILMGSSGSGKTVALAHFASQVVRRDPSIGKLGDYIPVLVHVSDLLPQGQFTGNPLDTLTQAVSSQASKNNLTRLVELLQQALTAGRVLLLLDGLDECPPALHTEGIAYLKRLIEQFPGTRLVVAASPNNISGLTGLGLMPVAISGWDKPTCQLFIHLWGDRWQKLVVPAQDPSITPIDQHLMDAWLGGASDLLSPLELTLKVWSAYAGDALGAGSREAIKSYLDRITAGMSEARGVLESFAFHLISNLRIDLPEKEQLSTSAEKSSTPDSLAQAEPEFTGESSQTKGDQQFRRALVGSIPRLVEAGMLIMRSNNRLAFTQPVIAGALAAQAEHTPAEIEQILKQPEWAGKEALLANLVTGSQIDSLRNVLEKPDGDPLYHRTLNIARWLGGTPKASPLRVPVLRALASILTIDTQPLGLRVRAISALVQSGDAGVNKLLHQMLEAPSESQRLLAILGLGFSQDEQAVPKLSNLLDEASLAIGRAVCLALAAIGNKAAIESLAWALLNSDDTIRQSAAEALAKIPADGYPILEEGSQMEDLLVRRAVISGLVHVDLPRANQILEKLAIEDKEWVVRSAATHALDQLKSPELHIPHNLPALSESAWLIAFAGEHGLGVSPGKPADDLLRKALRAGTEEQKLAALDYLRLFGTQEDIPLILVIQQNFPGELREAAFNTIWHLGAAGIMPA